ncbi:MAG: hypothetical protein K1X94_04930 [Sandaracinaceae bacterium]|nr:hypothetical protein [Sandaracinaceae bacterium]
MTSALRGWRASALALLRLDAALVERVRREERLPELALSAALAIAIGAGAYGAAFGLWRAPLQASFSALKLPCVLLGVATFTAASSAALAPLLGARLRPLQSIVAVLASLAVTSAILGALAPVAIVLVASLPPPGSPDDAAVGQSVVLAHTLVIAVAGTAGVLQLLRLLAQLVPSHAIAKRVVLAWIATQLLIGAQLSWVLRPFVGQPRAAITLLSPQAFEGGFFEEILHLAGARFGGAAPWVLGGLGVTLTVWVAMTLTSDARDVAVRVWPRGLEVMARGAQASLLDWSEVVAVTVVGACVLVRLTPDESLVDRTLEVRCANATAAASLARAIEQARAARHEGPYRLGPAEAAVDAGLGVSLREAG